MGSTPTDLTADQRSELLGGANADALSALMRSTWTWDDRALRRRLSEILVQIEAVRELHAGDVGCHPEIIEAAECSALAAVGEFVAEVLGPRLLVSGENRHRETFLPLVEATSELTAQADRALRTVAVDVAGRVIERDEELTSVLPPDSWQENAFGNSSIRLARVAYSAGYAVSDSAYFGAAGLGGPALAAAAHSTYASVDPRRTALAAAERTGSWDPALVRSRATETDTGWSISGEKWYVLGAADASTILVIARTVGGPSLYSVDASAPGVHIEPLESLDTGRPLARVVFDGAPAVLVGREGSGGRTMNRTVDVATTVLGGEQMGLVDRTLACLAKMPPAGGDGAGWLRYTRALASLELSRASATALWYRAVRLQNTEDTDSFAIAAGRAHIACSGAIRTIALALKTVGAELDPALTESIAARSRTTDLLLGGPALAHERLLERMGI